MSYSVQSALTSKNHVSKASTAPLLPNKAGSAACHHTHVQHSNWSGRRKVFIKRLPNLGEWKLPGFKPFSSAKHRKKPATPRTRIRVQISCSIPFRPPGAQGLYVNRSPSLSSRPSPSQECTLVGLPSPSPHCSSLPLPGPEHTAKSLQPVV